MHAVDGFMASIKPTKVGPEWHGPCHTFPETHLELDLCHFVLGNGGKLTRSSLESRHIAARIVTYHVMGRRPFIAPGALRRSLWMRYFAALERHATLVAKEVRVIAQHLVPLVFVRGECDLAPFPDSN